MRSRRLDSSIFPPVSDLSGREHHHFRPSVQADSAGPREEPHLQGRQQNGQSGRRGGRHKTQRLL